LWISEVGPAKLASANIETIFSGAGRLSKKSRKMSAQLLSDYCFIHYNYKYEWLRPAVTEIVAMYKQIYGKKGAAVEEDSSSDNSDSEGEDSAEEGEGAEEQGEE
jgi:hypothetical protein